VDDSMTIEFSTIETTVALAAKIKTTNLVHQFVKKINK